MATSRQEMRDEMLRVLDRELFIVHCKEEAFNKLPPEYRNQYSKQRLAVLREHAENLDAARQRLNNIKANAGDTLFNAEVVKVRAAMTAHQHELSEVSPLQTEEHFSGLAELPWRQARVAERLMFHEFSSSMGAEEQAECILKRMNKVELEETVQYAELKRALESFRTKNDYYKQVLNNSIVAESEQRLAAEKAREAYYELRAKSHQVFELLTSMGFDTLAELDEALPTTLLDPEDEIEAIRNALFKVALAKHMLAEIKASSKGTKHPDYPVWQQNLTSAQKELQQLRQKSGVKVDFESATFSISHAVDLATHPIKLGKFIHDHAMMFGQFSLIFKSGGLHHPEYFDISNQFSDKLKQIRKLKKELSQETNVDKIQIKKNELIQAIHAFLNISRTVRDIVNKNPLNVLMLEQTPNTKKDAQLWEQAKTTKEIQDKFFALDPTGRFNILITLPAAAKVKEAKELKVKDPQKPVSEISELEEILTEKQKRKKILRYDEGQNRGKFKAVFLENFTEGQLQAFLAREFERPVENKEIDDFKSRSPRELLETRLQALQKAQRGSDRIALERATREFDDATAFLFAAQLEHHRMTGDIPRFIASRSSDIAAYRATQATPKKGWLASAWEWMTSWWKSKPAPSTNTRKIEQRLSTETHEVHSQQVSKHESKHYSVFSHQQVFLQQEKADILTMHDRVHRMVGEGKQIDPAMSRNLNRMDELFRLVSAAAARRAGMSEYHRKNKSTAGESRYEMQAQDDYQELLNLMARVRSDLTSLESPQPVARKGAGAGVRIEDVELKVEDDEGEGKGEKQRRRSR